VSNKVFIDTLHVIALINQRDDYHDKAVKLADAYESEPLITTDAVLLEIGNGLARAFKPQAIEIIDDFLTSSNVEIIHLTPELFEHAYSLYKQYQDKEWGAD
jgi:predicted nucleic acid-binding protein